MAALSQAPNPTTPGQDTEARITVAAQMEATTMGKRAHRPMKPTAPTRMGTTHGVGIRGTLTHEGNTTPITSVKEVMPAGISSIARITSVSGHTLVLITLITSVIEGLPRGASIASIASIAS